MFRHVGLVVVDLERQLSFYRDLLGLEIVYHEVESGSFLEKILSLSGVSIEIYKLGRGGQTVVELLKYNYPEEEPNEREIVFNKPGLNHFALTVSDVDSLYEKLSGVGVRFISEPTVNEMSTHKVCFCRDYESNLIEIVEEL